MRTRLAKGRRFGAVRSDAASAVRPDAARQRPVAGGRWLACFLAVALAGCTAKEAPKPREPERAAVPVEAVARPKAKRRMPRPKDCGPVLDPKIWKIQCEEEGLAMTCRRSDPTDRRCASRQNGKLRWTYGAFCDGALPCYRKACPP